MKTSLWSSIEHDIFPNFQIIQILIGYIKFTISIYVHIQTNHLVLLRRNMQHAIGLAKNMDSLYPIHIFASIDLVICLWLIQILI